MTVRETREGGWQSKRHQRGRYRLSGLNELEWRCRGTDEACALSLAVEVFSYRHPNGRATPGRTRTGRVLPASGIRGRKLALRTTMTRTTTSSSQAHLRHHDCFFLLPLRGEARQADTHCWSTPQNPTRHGTPYPISPYGHSIHGHGCAPVTASKCGSDSAALHSCRYGGLGSAVSGGGRENLSWLICWAVMAAEDSLPMQPDVHF